MVPLYHFYEKNDTIVTTIGAFLLKLCHLYPISWHSLIFCVEIITIVRCKLLMKHKKIDHLVKIWDTNDTIWPGRLFFVKSCLYKENTGVASYRNNASKASNLQFKAVCPWSIYPRKVSI